MEKKNPIQKGDHTLKIRFPRWVFLIGYDVQAIQRWMRCMLTKFQSRSRPS